MAITTFTPQETYSRNKGVGVDPKKKLTKLKSVRVTNLDRLRLSMRKEKFRFDRSFMASSNAACDPSMPTSTPMSGKSSASPNYMKATTCSSARKGSSVENIISQKKSLKRVSTVKYTKKLSSMKSMKIRAKYSQFPEYCDNGEEGTKISDADHDHDQESMAMGGDEQKSLLNRSRSIKLTRLRSKRYPSRLPKSRFSVVEKMPYGEELSTEQPHYMQGTGSHKARNNPGKGLTRTPSLRPLRILAKIPSMRPRNSKVRKRPPVTPLYRTSVNRATCSSTLKRSEFPDHIELHAGGRESEGTSSVHICPYSYCSLNGHHHHAPSPPLKEFITAKRQSSRQQKGKQLQENVEHSTIIIKKDQSMQMIPNKLHALRMVNSTPPEEDDGLDYFITIYAKPRRKSAVKSSPSSYSEAITDSTYNTSQETNYDWGQPEVLNTKSPTLGRQEVINEDLQEPQGIFRMDDVETKTKIQEESSITTSNEPPELFISEEKVQSSGGDLINILSDNEKYTNIWHLIFQQFVSSDLLETGTEGILGTNEKEGRVSNTCNKGQKLDQDDSKNNKNLNDNEDEDNQGAATEKPDFDQTAALKLVQEGLNAILEHDEESVDQQSKPGHDMTISIVREFSLTPEGSTEEYMEVGDRPKKMKLRNPSEAEMPRQQMSKSYNKLRKIFVTAKIIKAMERMKKISPRHPRYLPVEPTSEEEKVYLRHLSRKEKKNTEECMLDYALRWAISTLAPDQQRKVARLVEAFETVTPERREGIRQYPIKGKTVTSALATAINEEPGKTMNIPDEEIKLQQDVDSLQSQKSSLEESSLREAHDYQTRSKDLPLESSGNGLKAVDTQVNEERMVKETLSISEDPSQSPTTVSEVSNAGDMTTTLFNKQKYSCMWNLIYQHVTSCETSMEGEQGDNVFDEEQKGEAIMCNEANSPESNGSSYNANAKEDENDQKESDQSAAVKLVKEALDAILKSYEESSERESLGEDGRRVEKHAHPEGQEETNLRENTTVSHQQREEPNELKNPLRKMSKSYQRLKKAFVTAKFINAIQRLSKNSPRKRRVLPPDAADLKQERVFLRHLSTDGRRSDEECMLDYALRNVILKMAPDQQRRVAQLVEAFETVTPQQKKKGLIGYPSEIDTATLTTHTSVPLGNSTDKKHQKNISDEQGYHIPQSKDNGLLLSSEGNSYDISLQEDHERKTCPAAKVPGHITLQKTVEAAISERATELSQLSSISTASNDAADGIEENINDAEVAYCYETEGSKVKSEGDATTILSDKQKYTSMWHLIHQQMVSSDASKITKQEFNEIEGECQEMKYPDLSQNSSMQEVQKEEDSKSAVLNQSDAIKLVKEAIDAILQSHEQRLEQQSLQYDNIACDDSPTKENPQEGKQRAEKHRNPRSEDNLDSFHEKDATSIPLQMQDEQKAIQSKMSNNHSKLNKLIVTAKFIAAMERLRKMNWRKPRHLPLEAASQEERVYLRHLSIDGRKNHEEWMLDYALRSVISSLAPDQQRKVALLVGAFETVTPEKKGDRFECHVKHECSPAIKSKHIEDEKDIARSGDSSMVCEDSCPKIQDDRLNLCKCDPLERNQKDEFRTDISDSNLINLNIHQQASPKGCPVQDPLIVSKEPDANISRTPQHASLSENGQHDSKHNIGKSLFSDKEKNNSMWHLICQHLQSASALEGVSKLGERLGNSDHMVRDDATLKMMTDEAYDDIDSDASSVTSELTENDAFKLVKETIDDILERPQVLDNGTSASEIDEIAEQNPEKSLSRGYNKLRQLIICNKFIKTMQKMRKIHPQKQNITALYPTAEARKTRHKSSGAGEKKDTEEWMLDNVLQKVISGLAPAKQRRVALLVEAFEKVNPELEEKGTGPVYMRKEPTNDISLEENAKENKDSHFQSSQRSSDSPHCLILKPDTSVTASNMTVSIDRVPQDIYDDRNQSLRKEIALSKEKMEDENLFKFSALPFITTSATSELCRAPIEASCVDEQGAPPNEMKIIEKQLVSHCDQETKFAKKASLPVGLKDEGNHTAQTTTFLDRENTTSLWGLILQHVKADVLEKVEMQLSSELDTEGNSKSSSQSSSERIHDKEVDIQTPTSFQLYENEAIKLVQEAVNELLTLPEHAGDNQSLPASTTSESRESPSPDAARAEASRDTIATPEDEKAPPKETLSSTYNKLSRVIMCKRFIKAMNEKRQLKSQAPQEIPCTAHTEERGGSSLRQTETGEKKSWEEGMLDHALQQVVGKLAPAQKKRVALLVQAFETVGLQPEPETILDDRKIPARVSTSNSFSSNQKPTKFRLSRSQAA